jgi:hypothetical protein
VFIRAGHYFKINPNFNHPFIPKSSKMVSSSLYILATRMFFLKTEEIADYGEPTLTF